MKKSEISSGDAKAAKSKRGGRRPGAGRKPTIAGEVVGAMVPHEHADWLRSQPGGVPVALRAAVAAAFEADQMAKFGQREKS